MLNIKKTARTVLAAILAVTVAATFYPASAFAGTDYEAAYNQAQAATQTAYTDWQNAIAERDALEIAYNQAKAEAAQAAAAVEPAYQEMLKKQRLLDLKTRQKVEAMSETDYKHDFGSSFPERYKTQSRIDYIVSDNCQFYNVNGERVTPAKLRAIQAHLNSKTSSDNAQWNTPGKGWRANNPNNKKSCPQGFTASAYGTDDTASLTLYQKYVYYNQSYNTIMLDLEYFDELNQVRQIEGKAPLKVSSYVMLQSTINAPMNIYYHNTLANANGITGSQNLIGDWGDTNCYTNGSSTDPYNGLYWVEKPNEGGHYKAIIGDFTHAGIACSVAPTAFDDASFSSTIFEQDFYKEPKTNVSGYTVNEYRNAINAHVSSELAAYNNAKSAYNQAQANAENKADDANALLYDYADAKTEVAYAKTAYDNAVAAQEAAYNAWQDWLNNQNTGGNEGDDEGGNGGGNHGSNPGTNPDPGQTITSVGDITGLTVSSGGKDGNEYIINVSWNAATNANKYQVYEKAGSNSYVLKTTTSSRSVQFYTTSANTTFKYQVRGIYENGSATIYGTVTTSSVYTTPAAETSTLAKVTNVKIVETGWNGLTQTKSVNVTWNPVTNAYRYNVYKSINNGNFELADTVGSGTTQLNINDVPYGGTIKCKIAAVDANRNEGPMSDVATLSVNSNNETSDTGGGSTSTPENTATVGTVTGLKATEKEVKENYVTVNLTWNKASNASMYMVLASTDGNSYKNAANSTATNTTITLNPNTKYWFKVQAKNASATGTASAVLNVTTSKYTKPDTVGKPSIKKIAPTAKKKTADIWFNGASNAKSYKIEIRRTHTLTGKKHNKKKSAVTSWKAYNTTVTYKTGWIYQKKISKSAAKKYKNNANYKLTKSGSKYKLYKKGKIAPVKATKLTRYSIYQVRVTAINGSAKQTSVIKTFTIK